MLSAWMKRPGTLRRPARRGSCAELGRVGLGPYDHVFLYWLAPLKKVYVHAHIRDAGARVGVKVSPHRLRHACATQLLNAGCRVTSIQRFLGHKRFNSTMVYARAHDATVAEDHFRAMEEVEANKREH